MIDVDGKRYLVAGESIDDPDKGRYWWVFPKMVYRHSDNSLLQDDFERQMVIDRLTDELKRQNIPFEL